MEQPEHRRISDREQEDRLNNLEESVSRIERLLTPIAETYTTATTLGKWAMGLLVFISVGIGIVLGLIKLIGDHVNK